uniref:Phosphoinositide phospholipase C n=1 Tax=Neolamprologus brichardi TaxID=32507 RepID=A0A3Q4HLY3_NEOBR
MQGEMTEYRKIVIKRDLEMGVVMTVFRQKAERLTVQVIMETRQVAWTRTADKTDGVLDLSEIREIRPGRNSKDFERFKDGKDKHDESTCFTIFYGSQFVLSTLSLGADSVDEAQKWLVGLEMLREETRASPTPVLIERTQAVVCSCSRQLDRSFHALLSQEVGSKKDRLDFEQFHKFYNLLMFEQNEVLDEFKKESCAFILGNTDKPDASAVLLHDFQRFLIYQQQETWANDLNQVRELMTTFIDDTMRKTNDPEFTVSEFLGFLFSKENCIWDEKFSDISNVDMNNPLSHYWVNSSHNTYLTGDQIRSESSTEAYVRCLRLGCRCVELDCWEGPGEPIIYHGWSRTTKIKFEDVVRAINEHAFVTSEFPVILSIEEHCPIDQQRQMARIFREVFGDKLLIEPVEHLAEQLPSPTQLKGKIILKVTWSDSRPGLQYDPQLFVVCPVRLHCIYQNKAENTFKLKWKLGLEYIQFEFKSLMSMSSFLSFVCTCFRRGGRVQHCRIRSVTEGGHTSFYMTPNLHFPSVYALIQHYKDSPLRCQDFELRLTDAVPKPDSHLQEGFPHCHREHLHNVFRTANITICYQLLSFRGDGKVKHCRIQKEGNMYLLGTTTEFESLVELVGYFRKKPLYRKIKLRYPVTPELVDRFSTPKNTVKALYSYQARRPDELSFQQGALIHNVSKEADGCQTSLGLFVFLFVVKNGKYGKPHAVTLQDQDEDSLQFDLTAGSLEELFEWYKVAWDIIQRAMKQQVEVEKKAEVAKEMSEVVVYCQPRSKEKDRFGKYVSARMSNADRLRLKLFYSGSCVHPDKYMQLNNALFSLNGQTGYVLQPEFMRMDSYDPHQDKKEVKYKIVVKVIGARHLPKPGRSIASPFVEIELCGHTEEKYKTIVYRDNGLNPVWKGSERIVLSVYEPELTFLRFIVNEEDMFSDPNFLAQATFPVKGLRSGYRSVPLKNGYSEDLELASLLVYISVQQAGKAEEELYSSSSQLKKKQAELGEPFLYDTHSNLQRSSLAQSKEKKINNSKFYS